MAVFNNELYVAGKLSSAGGNSVNRIAKWNGSTWSSVGGGTGSSPNGIRDMLVHNNALYVVGDFTQMGGVTTGNVAMWDNYNWSGLGLTHDDSFVNCIEVFNNKIYVGTYDFSKSHLFRYDGNTDINELSAQININIFPNPVNTQITIEVSGYKSADTEIRIYNIEGKELEKIYAKDCKLIVDVSDWNSGIYFVKLISDNASIVKKIIKE